MLTTSRNCHVNCPQLYLKLLSSSCTAQTSTHCPHHPSHTWNVINGNLLQIAQLKPLPHPVPSEHDTSPSLWLQSSDSQISEDHSSLPPLFFNKHFSPLPTQSWINTLGTPHPDSHILFTNIKNISASSIRFSSLLLPYMISKVPALHPSKYFCNTSIMWFSASSFSVNPLMLFLTSPPNSIPTHSWEANIPHPLAISYPLFHRRFHVWNLKVPHVLPNL